MLDSIDDTPRATDLRAFRTWLFYVLDTNIDAMLDMAMNQNHNGLFESIARNDLRSSL